MKWGAHVLSLVMLVVFSAGVMAAEFKPYPAAKVDEKATKAARDATGMMTTTIYTTIDSYDKVYAFYKTIGKEYKMPPAEGSFNLRSGGVLKEAYFIFDGAADIIESKNWIKIQRPYLGAMKASFPPDAKYVEDMYDDVRDVTVIVK